MMTAAATQKDHYGNTGLTAGDKAGLATLLQKQVSFDVSMKRLTTLGVGGPADAVAKPQNTDSLIHLLNWARKRGIPWLVVGAGSNLLVKDGGIRGLVIAITPNFKGIALNQGDTESIEVTVKAGTRLQTFCRHSIERGWGDMTFAVGIPASVGGAIAMNAGAADGCMGDVLAAVRVVWPSGQVQRIPRINLTFTYRCLSLPRTEAVSSASQGVIVDGTFTFKRANSQQLQMKAQKIQKERKRRQPSGVMSAGCFFKNPLHGPAAGELIDRAGLKGRRVGGAEISTRHANFIINRKNARAADILALADLVKTRVADQFGIHLQPEVTIVGES